MRAGFIPDDFPLSRLTPAFIPTFLLGLLPPVSQSAVATTFLFTHCQCNGSMSTMRKRSSSWLARTLLGLLIFFSGIYSKDAFPLTVKDTPYDWGTSLTLTWQPTAERHGRYQVWRKTVTLGQVPLIPSFSDSSELANTLSEQGWIKVAEPGGNDTTFTDSNLSPDSAYFYALAIFMDGRTWIDAADRLASPERQYFDTRRTNILLAVLIFVLALVALVQKARKGSSLFIRRIAGLEAIEEAVGRATEMGRPVLYIPGLDPMDEVATVAAIDILGQVAKKAAEYSIRLVVPNRDPIVMTVAQQVVRESYSAVGKPHLFREQDIFYVTFSQFGFAAAMAGLMIRERPATNFFIGHFYAESLVLAETGNATGAIQIAGTDADAQLPFFITSCDYTLIGEELYAGSVYLSRQPLMLGALKAQDYAKAVVIGAMIVTTILYLINPNLAQTIRNLFG